MECLLLLGIYMMSVSVVGTLLYIGAGERRKENQ